MTTTWRSAAHDGALRVFVIRDDGAIGSKRNSCGSNESHQEENPSGRSGTSHLTEKTAHVKKLEQEIQFITVYTA